MVSGRVSIIANSVARHIKRFQRYILPVLQTSLKELSIHYTTKPRDAEALAEKICKDQGADIIVAAGGDGTLNEVVNGMMASRCALPILGLIPIGSGNDFARTMNLRSDVNHFLSSLEKSELAKLDVGRVAYTTFEGDQLSRCFLNVADIGMGPEVVQRVMKARIGGAHMRYYTSILKTFASYRKVQVSAITPEWTWTGPLRSLGVCNGKYYGHGLCISPDADPTDGRFGVFICGDVSVLDFVIQSENLKKGKFLSVRNVSYHQASEILLRSDQRCLIETDGEVIGTLPASVSVLPSKISFLK